MDPTLPASFPFNGDMDSHGGIDSGLIGPFFAPAKTVFLFDPMFLLILLLDRSSLEAADPRDASLLRRHVRDACARTSPSMPATSGGPATSPGAIATSRAPSNSPPCSPFHFCSVTAKILGRTIWNLGLAITAASVVIQCASLAFWLPLEIYQMDAFGRHTWVVPPAFQEHCGLRPGQAGRPGT